MNDVVNRCVMKRLVHIGIFFVWLVVSPGLLVAQDFTHIAQQKPIAFNGNVSLRGLYYNASGIPNRMDPYNYVLSGSPTLSIYGWTIPTSFTFSKQERNFQQPFNQYGLSPTYKWVTLHAGYRNVTFSPYTLAGHTMLGGGFEINPGKLRIGMMYGRLNRATVIDTTSMSLVPYSFSRKGLAAKIGYGSATNYIDLSFLHARDDSTSMPGDLAVFENQIKPAANSVVAYATKFTLFKRFFVESDGAISLLTRDLNSTLTLDSIPDKTLRNLAGLLDINGSSEWFLAFNAGVGYQGKNYAIKTNYRRIEPGFTSMGAYFFNNDIENLTISPSYNHPSGKFRANVSFGLEQDNIRLQKEATSRRVIASGLLSGELTPQLGLDINFNNFSNNQRPNTLRFADSLKIVQTTRTIGIMPRYTIQQTDKIQILLLSANISSMNDYNSYFDNNPDVPSRDITTSQYLLNYTISFPQKRLSLSSSLSYTNLNSEAMTNSYRGITLGANYAFANNKLTTGINSSIMQGKSQGNKSLIFNGSANIGYTINKWQSLRAMMYFTKNNPGSAITGGSPSFSETRGELAYQFNFGL